MERNGLQLIVNENKNMSTIFAVHGYIELLLYMTDVETKYSENPTDYAVVYFGTLCSQIVISYDFAYC